jgi:hypothetical protein
MLKIFNSMGISTTHIKELKTMLKGAPMIKEEGVYGFEPSFIKGNLEWNSLLLIIASNSFLSTGFCIILLYNLMPFNMPPSPNADNPDEPSTAVRGKPKVDEDGKVIKDEKTGAIEYEGDVYLNNYFERRQRQYKDNPDYTI